MRHLRLHRLIAVLATAMVVATAQPAFAAWEGSSTQRIISSSVDLLLVRPLATGRVVVGAAMMVPAALLAWPGGRENVESAYDLLIREPANFAFERPIGKFDE